MGLLTKMTVGYGGNDDNSNKRTYTGDHAIDTDKVLAATDDNVINPLQPGNWESIRSQDVVSSPQYFTKEQAQQLRETAKAKTEGATASKKAYKSLEKIEKADTAVHKSHRGYQKTVANCEAEKLRSNARLARRLHGLRPEYTQMGKGVENAASKADARILELRTKVKAGM
ncbi:hypothetical protein BV372_08125 [Nostoc sp. T09]|uniref:hypothetical protein n=1 Tax=Nostoc sp. T09 TaxID=1932621 RepID=UPI000A3CE9BC|nr:hypothetical protein [Nostoc sp. T09]OUL36374.1 hypothetical protein BV372_08125 [Nostoc sp. T09]